MLHRLNAFLQYWLPYLTPVTVVLGVTILSGASSFSYLVQWIFAFISFSSCLMLKLQDVKKTISHPLPIIVCLFILQLVIPLLAFGLGTSFFNGDVYTITGLVLAFSIPTGVITLMWVSIFKGNTAVTLAIVLCNTMLSPILVPFTLNILLGAKVTMDASGLMLGLLWMVVVPSLLGLCVNQVIKEKSIKLGTTLAPFSKICMLLVILLNSAVVSPYFKQVNVKIVMIGLLVFMIACFGYVIGLLVARMFRWEKDVAISLAFNSGMRNSGVGSALAITFFPPAVAFPIVIAIVFQQFLASVAGRLAHKYFDRVEKRKVSVDTTNSKAIHG
ncbi:bile acid:sodium symporter family protein [Halalkalibacter kiskunsagensis]|uniref:Bile acid:sodium symporter family protein n=1 Tax=Halalkalibacter kiskunsagensis TaxID=1548599 RepID=A0ABV6KFI2_9BACI